ncbi:MAG: LicD family protein [Mycoplasma sp.]
MNKDVNKSQQMSLDEIKAELLILLKKVTTFCHEHNLKYSLAYGTLLGAIRHKGFIPWDDDIDIMMPRDDYEYLLKNYKDNDSYILTQKVNKFSHESIPKLISKNTYGYDGQSSCKKIDGYGVFLDIFPLDEISTNKKAVERKMKKFNQINLFMRFSSLDIRNLKTFFIFFFGVGILEFKFINYLKMPFVYPYRLIKTLICRYSTGLESLYDKLNSRPFDNDSIDINGKKFLFLFWNDSKYEWALNIKDFENYEIVLFEGIECRVISSYDIELKNNYKDYMALPPIECQQPSHNLVMFKKS